MSQEWYEVYEDNKDIKREYNPVALCKHKYTAETVARYFPDAKIRLVRQRNEWAWEKVVKALVEKQETL